MLCSGQETRDSLASTLQSMHVVTSEWAYASIRSQCLQPPSEFPVPGFKEALLQALDSLQPAGFHTPVKGMGPARAVSPMLSASLEATSGSVFPLSHGAASLSGMSGPLPSVNSQSELLARVAAGGEVPVTPLSKVTLSQENSGMLSREGSPHDSFLHMRETTAPGELPRTQGAVRVATGAKPQDTIPGWGLRRWGPEGWNSSQWGLNGVWLEPFDVESSQRTLQMLFAHYSSQASDSPTMASASQLEFSGTRAGGGC